MTRRGQRCPECGRPMQFDDAAREWECPECDEVQALDTMLRSTEGVIDVNEYDEEDRP